MAKRTFGLGNAAKKRQKLKEGTVEATSSDEKAPSNQLTVELGEEVDSNDEFQQLKALFKVYTETPEDDEKRPLLVNGLIHECDRLLKNNDLNGSKELPDYFYSIYATSLFEESKFCKESEAEDFQKAALDRCQSGLEVHPDSAELNKTFCLKMVEHLMFKFYQDEDAGDAQDKDAYFDANIEQFVKRFETYFGQVKEKKGELVESEDNFKILDQFDDLLNLVLNNGKSEEADSDEEEAGEDEGEAEHQFQKVLSQIDHYLDWCLEHLVYLQKKVSESCGFRKELTTKVAELLLMKSSPFVSSFTEITYEVENPSKKMKSQAKRAQEQAIELISQAAELFRQIQDDEEPKSWVELAESLIELGNVQDLDSKEQEASYNEAEKLLRRANAATNDKYKNILDNLLGN